MRSISQYIKQSKGDELNMKQKLKWIIPALLLAAVLLSLAAIWVNNVRNAPYQFPENWDKIPMDKKDEMMQIPEDTLEKMSTKTLIKMVLDCPCIFYLYIYTFDRMGFEAFTGSFNGIRELIQREDGAKALFAHYLKEKKKGLEDGEYLNRIDCMEIMLAQPEFSEKLSAEQLETLNELNPDESSKYQRALDDVQEYIQYQQKLQQEES